MHKDKGGDVELVVENTIGSAWIEALKRIYQNPAHYREKDQLGNAVREILNLSIVVESPLEPNSLPEHLSEDAGNLFADCLMDIDKARSSGFVPGKRLRDFRGSDQLIYVINVLKEQKASRRASIMTLDPTQDWADKRPPSITQIDFKVREERVHLIAILRSSDIYRTWPLNAYSLSKLLELVSIEIKVPIGTMTTFATSAHIYQQDLGAVVESLALSSK